MESPCFNGAAIFGSRKAYCGAIGVMQLMASMGPRSLDRGKIAVNYTKELLGTCFNGAAIFGSRKEGGTIRGVVCPPGFNGAAIFGSRKGCPAHGKQRGGASFNGAAIFGSRKG